MGTRGTQEDVGRVYPWRCVACDLRPHEELYG